MIRFRANTRALWRFAKLFITREAGVTAVEYAFIAALIAIALVLGAAALGIALNAYLGAIGGYLDTIRTGS